MEAKQDNPKNVLAQNDAIIDRLREVALQEFEKGADGLRRIIKELTAVQSLATEAGLQGLFDCLADISTILQNWLADPVFIQQLGSLKGPWSDVVCELSNYFVFMSQEDEKELRSRVNYRLVQLAKASAELAPAIPPSDAPASDGSWGLFDETASVTAPAEAPAAPAAAAPAPLEHAAASVAPAAPAAVKPKAAAGPLPDSTDNHLASHYLICMLGSQQYALPIHQVREILEQRNEKPLPSQRPGIRGLVTVRGMVCPVVDVSHVLHAKEENVSAEEGRKRCMVVCEVDRRTFCFNVDDVKQVASLDEFDDQITPLSPENSIQKAISHVSHFQNRSVLFVKMREVIPA
jgi:chemotaxis signal transduction protein